MADVDLKKLLQRAIELVMPNLRHYYRVVRKGRVVKSYASDGFYWADIQPLRNDDSDDPAEPIISRVEIPIMWGGPERGVVCPPAVGTLCDIEYYDGDPNYPRISNFRWQKNKAPNCEQDAFIIQQSPGVFIKITPAGAMIHKTGAGWTLEAGGPLTIQASSGSATMSMLTIDAAVLITGDLTVVKSITAAQEISDRGGSFGTLGDLREDYEQHTHQEHGDGGGETGPPL
ncbi:baseplate assembly protein [Geobacter sp. SVR]|uniref:baseplate assembly protein n=1 Tax=Geobacter sp. SVR TaxID=2495594 RepID=UPI00143F042C|nr:baseplate assembly protein [Geobacter sp. SVR]BCS54567.1 baseplate assembly protein [Geobacter sp. SVR]GCF86926.1 hypothetical protein GSbR_35260 [Geobacter sp. SVR]